MASESAVVPRAVLFDLDDTLVPWQTIPHWQWAWKPRGPVLSERHARAAIRRSVHAWDRRRWKGITGAAAPVTRADERLALKETLLEVAGHPLPSEEVEAVLDRFEKPAHEFETFPDVTPALKWLESRSVPYGVLTPFAEELARHALKRVGVADSVLVFADRPGSESRLPAAAAFRAAAQQMGVDRTSVLYIADLYWSDVRAGVRAGLNGHLIDRSQMFDRLEGPRLTSLAQLPTLFEPASRDAAPAPSGP